MDGGEKRGRERSKQKRRISEDGERGNWGQGGEENIGRKRKE